MAVNLITYKEASYVNSDVIRRKDANKEHKRSGKRVLRKIRAKMTLS